MTLTSNHIPIKVCGMRNAENILALSELDVQFMGLIFFEKSKRFVQGTIPDIHIPKVGVFVNETYETIIQKIREYQLDYIQLHGDETPVFCQLFHDEKVRVIKAFRVNDDFDFDSIKQYEEHCDYFLFDAKGKDYGGNGITFNWKILNQYQGKIPFFLSGGIHSGSVSEIKDFRHPQLFALDINSGFEIQPALKDIDLIHSFIHNIKA